MPIQSTLAKVKSSFINFEFRLLKKRLKRYGYDPVFPPIQQTTYEETVLENVFASGHQRNALLSYIIYPFAGPVQCSHSNHQECFALAEILNDLKYNVDVINWNNTSFIPQKHYELVIDNHNNLFRLSGFLKDGTLRIFHATNSHWLYQNAIEYHRHQEFFAKTGIAVKPTRLISAGNNAACCDLITMFGNNFTANTYGAFREKICHLPMSVTVEPAFSKKHWKAASKHFVWLNSHGALLKGLDVVLESFMGCPDLTLSVCGDTEQDREFFDAFAERMRHAPNIRLLGWVDVNGPEFEKLVSSAAWVVSASFSEGGGGSVLNCMAKGLVPILSRSSSITLPENTGFYLEQNESAALRELVKIASELPVEEIVAMSTNACLFIQSNHTLVNFKAKFKEVLINLEGDLSREKKSATTLC